MKYLIYILPFSVLLVFSSCENKAKTNNADMETKNEPAEIVYQQEKAEIDVTDIVISAQSTQEELFLSMAKSITENDIANYNKAIKYYTNIDTLFLYPSSEWGETEFSILGIACNYNKLEVVRDLVTRGADIRKGSEDEFVAQDALYYAIMGGNAEIVKILIDKGADVNALYSETGITPLVLCVMNKKYLMAEILLKAGANPNGSGNLGFDYILYPLHDAIRVNDAQMVKLLLQYGADASAKDGDNLNAIGLAKKTNATSILKLLEASKKK